MNRKHEAVSEDRVRELLDSYGADAADWPSTEREAALARLAHSDELQRRQRQARQLDALLQADRLTDSVSPMAAGTLARRILEQLPQQDTSTDTVRRRVMLLQRLRAPALAMAMAATVLLFVLVLKAPAPFEPAPLVPGAFEQWAWNDITGQDLVPARQKDELDFLELLELESSGV